MSDQSGPFQYRPTTTTPPDPQSPTMMTPETTMNPQFPLRVIPLDHIHLSVRQRKEIKPEHIQALKRSIMSPKGLMHPIVLSGTPTSPILVAGECRLRAITELHQDGLVPTHQKQPIPYNSIPFVMVSELTEADIAEAELEENILRAPLTWQEEVRAKTLIHKLRQTTNPRQSQRETANEITSITGGNPINERRVMQQILLVHDHLEKPQIATAKNLSTAYKTVVDEAERSFKAGLIRTKIVTSPHQILLGDCRHLMASLPSGEIDAIICDPPYGIDAHKMKKDELHLYHDSPEYALELAEFILTEGFRVLKPKGALFLFCDIDHYTILREAAKRQCYSTWRTPLVWQKGMDGHAPWGRNGFIRTYELILYAVKGQKELNVPGGPDIISVARTARNERVHAAEKPVKLLEKLLSLCTLQGDRVLDPCAGSGPILDAATNLRLRATAMELDPNYHREALARASEGAQYETVDTDSSSSDD